MQLKGTRFGEIDVDARKIIVLPSGLIGFPTETRFVILRPRGKKPIAWLQSLQTPALAFPVVDSTQISPPYPGETAEAIAGQAGIRGDSASIFVIVSVRPRAPRFVANLLAPIVIDRGSGNGLQVVLDPKKYAASTPLGSIPDSLRPTKPEVSGGSLG
jgi:flagellar assembly factor FliW